jgi:hypothetical protein
VRVKLLGNWSGFDNDTCCNLCSAMRPGPVGDERLLRRDFERFVNGASLYRTKDEGRVLVKEWARRRGQDAGHLLALVGLD